MAGIGLTKARSMGPVAEAVERAGGSLARVFKKAELPLRLVETPDQLILLKDQLAVVEYASQELDDATLPLSLSIRAGMEGLGHFGARVRAAPTLQEAIERCNLGIGAMLQSATLMRLDVRGDLAAWSYVISDAATLGRGKNELLAFGYMSETLAHFGAGPILRADLPERPPARAKLEHMLGCEISQGETARLIFAREHLTRLNPLDVAFDDCFVEDVPQPTDLRASVEHLIRLGLLDSRPTIDFVAARLGLSTRTLQRRLAETSAGFDVVRRAVLLEQAKELLADPRRPVTEVALELGYSDPAHFSRAFSALAGKSPRAWRRSRPSARADMCADALATPAAKA